MNVNIDNEFDYFLERLASKSPWRRVSGGLGTVSDLVSAADEGLVMVPTVPGQWALVDPPSLRTWVSRKPWPAWATCTT